MFNNQYSIHFLQTRIFFSSGVTKLHIISYQLRLLCNIIYMRQITQEATVNI